MASSIKQLSELISTTVNRLVATYDANDTKLPGIDDHFNPEAEIALRDKTSGDVNLIVSAALQLIASVSHPELSLYRIANGHVKSAALQTAIVAHVPEILREAGPQGMHCDAIAQVTDIDGGKLGRILRLLVSCHVFREVRPNVFANNRLSETLDTGKSVQEIIASPMTKHDNTPGFAALMECNSDELLKASAFLSGTLTDPATAHSQEINETAMQKAFDTHLSYFEWTDQPEQNYRGKRLGAAMRGLGSVSGFWPAIVLTGFDWGSLAAGSLVVDVGGGYGHGDYSMDVAKKYPHLQFIVQTTSSLLNKSQKMWTINAAEPFESGRFKLQAHNIFSPQPQKNASVFFLFFVITFLPDTYAMQVLSALREAATEDTKLLILTTIAKHACPESEDKSAVSATGSSITAAPYPLSPHYMAARQADCAYTHDIMAMMVHNGQERTFDSLAQLLDKCGWSVSKVVQTDVFYDFIQAVPM